jgi:hypothetical protein
MADYALESTFDIKFTSRAFATGIPTTLGGTPAVEIYEDNSTTQITGAEALTVDFDSVTGLNNLRIAATAANGFESGKSYSAVISTGTVGGVSVVGEVICNFTIDRANVATLTGHTPQTGDTYALANGAAGFVAIDTVVDAVKTKTDQLSFGTWGVEADLAGIDGSNIPVGNLASDYDGTGYNRANSTIGTVSTVTAFAGTITTLDALDAALDTAHGAGSWATATGFVGVAYESVLDDIDGNTQTIPADVVTALGTGSTLSSLATATELAKVPKSDGTTTWNATALGSINAQVDSAIETYHLDHLFAVDYDPASPPGTATALLNELIESDAGVSRFTVNALENAPSGTGASAAAIADAVWEEAIADHSGTSGSTAEALNAAGSAGDPWTTALPGSYTGTQAGKILSDVLTDTADLQANQGNWLTATGFSTHDAAAVVTALGTGSTLSALATAAELAKVPKSDGAVSWNATALASINTQCDTAISDAALATAAALATVDSNVDAILVDTGTTLPASIATIDTNVDAVLVDTGTTIPGAITTLQSTADAIETDTQDLQTQIGTAGAGLTDLGGMSTAMKAEVNAEADTAISDASLATAAELALAKLYSGRLLCIAAGNLSNAQNAAEQYTITLNGVAYTVTAAGLDADGNRGTTVFAEV